MQTQKKYVRDLFANCKAAIEASATDDPVLVAQKIVEASLAANPGNSWAEFRMYLDVIDDHCADVTGDVWDGVLAGVDVFGESNANVTVEILRRELITACWDRLERCRRVSWTNRCAALKAKRVVEFEVALLSFQNQSPHSSVQCSASSAHSLVSAIHRILQSPQIIRPIPSHTGQDVLDIL